MKKVVLLSTIVLGAAIGLGTQASADEVVNSKDSTPTQITIQDADDNGEDPLDPKDPNQTHLTLESVPDAYNFESSVKNKNYKLDATLTDKNIEVFNDRTDHEWSVKALVTDNTIKLKSDISKTFEVTSFIINDTEIAATGAKGIVAKAEDKKTSENNTGKLVRAVDSISISFDDNDNVLKAGNVLEGSVTYQLYNSADAS